MSGDDVTRQSDRVIVILVVAAVATILDQLTKTLALMRFQSHPADLGVLHLRIIFNRGTAFGFGEGIAPLFVAIGAGAVIAITVIVKPTRTRLGAVALGMVLGGATGNLLDRMFRSHNGAVVDFIDFRWWPVFNFADAAIVGGVVIFALLGRRGVPDKATEK